MGVFVVICCVIAFLLYWAMMISWIFVDYFSD